MDFIKMHGCGNDYLFIDCLEHPPNFDPHPLSIALSDRHFGVGSDGIVLILPSQQADVSMDMFNADGSEGGTCGNALRCVARYVYDQGYITQKSFRIQTKSGIRQVWIKSQSQGDTTEITVDMGTPVLETAQIPMNVPSETFLNQPLFVLGRRYSCSALSMGNPHLIVMGGDIAVVGPILERSRLFPQGVNISCVNTSDRSHIHARVRERGSGLTLACGSAACACLAACIIAGTTNEKAFVHLPGGILQTEYDKGLHTIFLTGDAVYVYRGSVILP